MLACQTHFVKKALAYKHASHRLSREAELAADFKTGDIVYKRSPGINKCLDASWEGPFIISQLLPPVNCSIVPQGKKSKPKVIHLSQLKKAAPIYRALIVPDEHVTDDFHIPSNTPQPVNLSPQQQLQLQNVLDSFPSVFCDTPGLTSLVEHSISVTSSGLLPTPIWSPSYSYLVSFLLHSLGSPRRI